MQALQDIARRRVRDGESTMLIMSPSIALSSAGITSVMNREIVMSDWIKATRLNDKAEGTPSADVSI